MGEDPGNVEFKQRLPPLKIKEVKPCCQIRVFLKEVTRINKEMRDEQRDEVILGLLEGKQECQWTIAV